MILSTTFEDLVLVDKSKSGKANCTNDGLVPDTFILPVGHALDAKSSRELWWKRSSFLVEYKKYDVDQRIRLLGPSCSVRTVRMLWFLAEHRRRVCMWKLRTRVAMDTSGPSFIWSAAVTAHSSSTLPWSLAKALGAPDKERRTGKMHGDYCFMVSLSMGVLGSGATSRVLHAS
ncbi:hypothetical protein BASA81_007987 [Batrachochytrium salamandrivorans]|nr:hypothetical protein BASA81_007987 [Batrachochytrium salamandrivorans]